jgi:hypothetical protein
MGVRVAVVIAGLCVAAIAHAKPCKDAPSCRAACEAGDPVACGRWQRKDFGTRRPDRATLARWDELCSAAMPSSCEVLGEARWASAPADALALWDRACSIFREGGSSDLATSLGCLQGAIARGRGAEARQVFSDLCLHLWKDELGALGCRRAHAMWEVTPLALGTLALVVDLPGDLEALADPDHPHATVRGPFPGIGDPPVAEIVVFDHVRSGGEVALQVRADDDHDRVRVERWFRAGARLIQCRGSLPRGDRTRSIEDVAAPIVRLCASVAVAP